MTTKQDILKQIEVLKKQVDELKDDEPISPYDDLIGAMEQGYDPGECYVSVRDHINSNWYTVKAAKNRVMKWKYVRLNPKKIVEPNWLPHLTEGMPEFLDDDDVLVIMRNIGTKSIKKASLAGWDFGKDYSVKEFFILEKAPHSQGCEISEGKPLHPKP